MSGARLLAVTHPINFPIERSEVEQALSEEERAAGWDLSEVKPLEALLGDDIDWSVAVAAQEELFRQHIAPALRSGQTLGYFGIAPVPLALHLGHRVTDLPCSRVFHRRRDGEVWRWRESDRISAEVAIKPLVLPEHSSRDRGSVVIRVSTSFAIAPSDTRMVVPESLAELDVSLVDPHENALEDVASIGRFAKVFRRALRSAKVLFPNLTHVDLFVASRGSIAFRIGTEIKATAHPSVMTYQYLAAGRSPRYQRAILLDRDGATGQASPRVEGGSAKLRHNDIYELHGAAIESGLAREVLLMGIDDHLIAGIRGMSCLRDQIFVDLHELNKVGTISDGSRPILIWLKNAAQLAHPRPQAAVFQAAMEALSV